MDCLVLTEETIIGLVAVKPSVHDLPDAERSLRVEVVGRQLLVQLAVCFLDGFSPVLLNLFRLPLA